MDRLEEYRNQLRQKDLEYESKSPTTKTKVSGVNPLETVARGAAQGLTSGFADEATALAEGIISNKPFKETYDKSLKESRANYKAAYEANPVLSTISDLAGGVIQPTPFGKVGAASKAAKIGTKMAQAGLMGGVEALGRSEGNDISDLLAGGAASAALTGATGLAGKGASKILGALKQYLPDRASVVGTLLMRDPEVLRQYQKVSPELYSKLEAQGEAKNVLPQVAESIESTLKETPFRKKASELSSQAYESLKKSDTQVDPTQALSQIEARLERLKDSTSPDKKIIRYLENKKAQLQQDAERYSTFGEPRIPASRIKNAIQTMDAEIGKGTKDYNSNLEKSIFDIRKSLDTELKKNKEYERIMEKTAAATEADKRIQQAFTTGGIVDPDKILKTVKTSKGIAKDRNLQRISDAMKKEGIQTPLGAGSMQELVEALRVKNAIDNPSYQGSNLMNYAQGIGMGTLGGAAGAYSTDSAAGLGTGSLAGGILGSILQRKSGTIARKAMDFKMPIPDIMNKVRGTRYERLMQNAIDISPRKAAVNMYLLGQKDPEFQKLIENENE